MISPMVGLWHIRNAPSAAVLVVTVLALTIIFSDISVGVSLVAGRPPRGLGAPEIFSTALAAALPTLTLPAFDGREALSGTRTRLTHTLVSLVVVVLPLLVIPTWVLRIHQTHPGAGMPSAWGLVGTPLLLSACAMIACLSLGTLWSVLLPPIGLAALAVGQHLYPGSILNEWFASGKDWHTSWPLCGAALAVATTVIWITRSVAPTDRR